MVTKSVVCENSLLETIGENNGQEKLSSLRKKFILQSASGCDTAGLNTARENLISRGLIYKPSGCFTHHLTEAGVLEMAKRGKPVTIEGKLSLA